MADAVFSDADTQNRIVSMIDILLRPASISSARTCLVFQNLRQVWLASPSGQASTMQGPAADSVGGIVAALSPGSVVPTVSGLTLARPLMREQILAFMTGVDAVINNYWTDQMQQLYALTGGAINTTG